MTQVIPLKVVFELCFLKVARWKTDSPEILISSEDSVAERQDFKKLSRKF